MHKINTSILTRFLFILDSTKVVQTGKTVTYEIRQPDDTVFDSGNMSEIGTTGIYKQSWTPNVVGWWILKISCASPVANDVRAYFVESGLEKDIKDLLEHATYGLSALETLVDGVEAELTVIKGAGFVQATDALSKIRDTIDALNDLSQADILSDTTPFAGADIATIKGYVDEIESLLKNGTYGLSALNTKLVAIQADLDNPNQYKADITTLALEATLTAIKGVGWTTETLKAIYDAMALESTLTAIKGGGWTNETLKAIKDAIDALNNLSASDVWNHGTRTLTDPNSYKADVSALALEATLNTHDTDIKTLLVTVQADLDNPNQYKADVSTLALEATLATHDTDIKALLEHGTYGLSALETLVDELETYLKHGTYGLSALNDDLDTLLSRLTSTRAGYLDELDFDLDARLGSPAGASISVDVAAVKTEVDKLPRIVSHMDFWSDSQAVTNITAGGESGVISLPDVVVAGLPANVTIIRVVALLKIAIVKDTSASDNAVDVATGHVEVQKGGSGGYVTAINVPEDAWSVDVSEATERGGDVMIGDNDLGPSGANKVDGNATYNFEFDDIGSDGTNLQLVDVMVGLRVYFTI